MDEVAPSSRAGRLGLLVGVVALGAVLVGLSQLGEAEAFLALARRASPQWLLVGLGMQAATYATEAAAWGIVLRAGGRGLAPSRLYILAVIGLFTSQAVPSGGISGTVVVVRGMTAAGAPRRLAVAAVIVDLLGYYLAFGATLAGALALLWARRDLPPAVLAMAGGIAVLGGTICGGTLWLATPGRVIPPRTRRIPGLSTALEWLGDADQSLVRAPRLIGGAALSRLGNFVADGLTLWACLRAVGTELGPADAIAACVVGTLARTIGMVPGGLGTFEGGAVGGLEIGRAHV